MSLKVRLPEMILFKWISLYELNTYTHLIEHSSYLGLRVCEFLKIFFKNVMTMGSFSRENFYSFY